MIFEDIGLPPGRQPLVMVVTGSHYGRDGIFVDVIDRVAEEMEGLAGLVDVIPMALEVTQAIRGEIPTPQPGTVTDDDVFLVGGKATTVRAYARLAVANGVDLERRPRAGRPYG